jgi:hypothetical protein
MGLGVLNRRFDLWFGVSGASHAINIDPWLARVNCK